LISEKTEGRERLVPVLKFDRVIFDVGIEEIVGLKKVANQ
jgi:hypothetical protein